jgi:hypothetical protein
MEEIESESDNIGSRGMLISIEAGIATINNLTIRNPDAVELLSKMHPTEVEQLITALISIIKKTVNGTTTAESIMKEYREQIEKRSKEMAEMLKAEINNLSTDLTTTIKQAISESFQDLKEDNEDLAEKIGEQVGDLQEIIDEKIHNRLLEILQKFAVKEKELEMIDKTTLKGFDFEQTVYNECKALTKNTEETVDLVSNQLGLLKKRTGDIIIQHHLHKPTLKPKTVIECKDQDLSNNGNVEKILAEINEACNNRGADVCLYLFKNKDQMPESLRPLKIGDRYMIASKEIGMDILLKLAKLVGGIECRIKHAESKVDIDNAKKEISKIAAYEKDFNEIIRLANLITEHSEKIYQITNALRQKILRDVECALKYLSGDNGDGDKKLLNQ